MRAALIVGTIVFCVASACATGGGATDGKKDGGIILAKDSGSGGDGAIAKKDGSTTGNDGSTSGCQTAAPSNVCGVFPQCGCGPSQTCDVDQTALDGSSSCVAAGSLGIGQACTATSGQCAAGLTCVWGECHPYCGTAGAKCTDPNTNTCVNLTDSSNNPIPNLLVCHIDCELADANACGGGSEGCIYFGPDQTDCYPVGTTTANCNATTSFCPPGQVCLTDQTNYFCLPWCRVGGSDCTTGTCNSLGTSAPTVNGVTYGYCQ